MILSWGKLPRFLKNKYIVTILVFFIWLIFFDQFNLIDRFQSLNTLHRLEKDKAYYNQKIIDDKKRLEELRTNKENLEKFAREQYLMKKDNEDIFVIVSDD